MVKIWKSFDRLICLEPALDTCSLDNQYIMFNLSSCWKIPGRRGCFLLEDFLFFFFFGKQTISLNKLSIYNRIGAHPERINTIQIILKYIDNVHRRTYKGHRNTFLNSTHSSKPIRTPISLTIAMFKLDPTKRSCQLPAVIQ